MKKFEKLWKPVAAFLGAATMLVQFIQLWRGDQSTVTWVTGGLGLLVIAAFLLSVLLNKEKVGKGFMGASPRYNRRQKRWAGWGLLLILLSAAAGTGLLLHHRARLKEQFIVVVARFNGPEEAYGLRNELLEDLRQAFADDPDVRIVALNEIVTAAQGSDYARQLGEKHLADLMLWGWYRPTENPNLTLHIENLSPATRTYLPASLEEESATLQPTATLSDLESFTLQAAVGQEFSALVAFLRGLVYYGQEDYEATLPFFDQAAGLLPAETRLLGENWAVLFFYRGVAYALLGQYEQAIADFTQTIHLNPQYAEAYYNRGLDYSNLGQYEQAIADYTQAIRFNPQYAEAYYNRGLAYNDLGQYEQAIADFTQAIRFNPQYTEAYYNRGLAYALLGQYEQAIADFTQAVHINSQDAAAYYNRGTAYAHLGQYKLAIANFTQAIHINPQFAEAYYNRGLAYTLLGQSEQAIADLENALQWCQSPEFCRAAQDGLEQAKQAAAGK